jgi:predicted DsbA family dithiol-disulfide isomerase
MPRTLRVDVWFDLICPWCWIGKRQLDQARERLARTDPDVRVDTHWHSVQLIPQVPPQGWPFAAFYEQRLGGPDAVRARQAQVLDAARRAGVTIDFSRIDTFPNTAAAHRLLALGLAQLSPEAHEALLQHLFEGYFLRGENLGDAATLAAIAAEHGVESAAVEPAAVDSATQDADDAAQRVSGVPLFVFDRSLALSGAQPAEVLWSAMRQSI